MIRGPESIYLTTTEMEQSEGRVPSNRRKVPEGLFIFLKTLHQVYCLVILKKFRQHVGRNFNEAIFWQLNFSDNFVVDVSTYGLKCLSLLCK